MAVPACPFLWYTYTHGGRFQATNLIPLGTESTRGNKPASCAQCTWLPGVGHDLAGPGTLFLRSADYSD